MTACSELEARVVEAGLDDEALVIQRRLQRLRDEVIAWGTTAPLQDARSRVWAELLTLQREVEEHLARSR